MNNKIVYKMAEPDDAAGIVHVRRTTWLATYPNEQESITYKDIEEKINQRTLEEDIERSAKRLVNQESARVWVAKDNGSVVGFGIGVKEETKNHIGALYILPEYQAKGIGTQLMNLVLEWLGVEKNIDLEVVTYNTKAKEFYKKFGFVEAGPTHNPVGVLPSGKELPQILMIKRF